jgi:hypothetical protein
MYWLSLVVVELVTAAVEPAVSLPKQMFLFRARYQSLLVKVVPVLASTICQQMTMEATANLVR